MLKFLSEAPTTALPHRPNSIIHIILLMQGENGSEYSVTQAENIGRIQHLREKWTEDENLWQ